MDVPILWSCIHINDGPSGGQDTPVHLVTFIHLSQTCPLDITFHLPLPSWNIVRENLVVQRSRIRAIDFTTSGNGVEESNYILRYLSPLRHLTRIGGTTFNPDQLIMDGSPLEQVQYVNLKASTLGLPGIRHLRVLRTTESIATIVALAKDFPMLRSVSLLSSLEPETLGSHQTVQMSPSEIDILGWTTLTYDKHLSFPLHLLRHLGHLVNFKLTILFKDVRQFLARLNHLSRLNLLSLKLTGDMNINPFNRPLLLPPCPTVRILRLYPQAPMENQAAVEGMIDAMTKTMTNVQELRLLGYG